MKKGADLGDVNKRHLNIGGKPGKPSKTFLNFCNELLTVQTLGRLICSEYGVGDPQTK